MTQYATWKVNITNAKKAERTRAKVTLGSRFLFSQGAQKKAGRFSRLFGREAAGAAEASVIPLTGKPIELDGLTVLPTPLATERLSCLVADRDLYRAEEDTVRLFVASPGSREGFRIVVKNAGEVIHSRDLTRESAPEFHQTGVWIEEMAMLLPGDYTAQLTCDGREGVTTRFTVAEYTLAPLSGRLREHALDRGTQELSFTLDVESYQLPFEQRVLVQLIEGDDVLASAELDAVDAGLYRGALPVSGEGALRLRLQAIDDAERICEVVIPGSRKAERQATVVSELGEEVALSLMPEPGALPLRGAYLSAGDFLATPVTIDEIVTEKGLLEVRAEMQCLVTITHDLCTGEVEIREHGSVTAGDTIELKASSAATVYVGGYVDGRPFESFTHLFRPSTLDLTVDAEPDFGTEMLKVSLSHKAAADIPVLVCVRDERLTATDTPQVALAATLKRGIDEGTANYGDAFAYENLGDDAAWARARFGIGVVGSDYAIATDALGLTSHASCKQLQCVPLKIVENVVVVGAANLTATRRAMLESELARSYRMPTYQFELDADTLSDLLERHEAIWPVPTVPMLPPMAGGFGAPAQAYTVRSRSSAGLFNRSADDEELDMLSESAPAPMPPSAPMRPSAPMAPPMAQSAPMPGAPVPMDLEAPCEEDAMLADVAEFGDSSDEHALVPEADAPRESFPEVLFYGLVSFDKQHTLEIPLGDSLGTFKVESFAMHQGDWAQQQTTVHVTPAVRVDLEVPPCVHTKDTVLGKVRGAVDAGEMRLQLLKDGAHVPLRDRDGNALPDQALPSPCEAWFNVEPGEYTAIVEAVATGEVDSAKKIVSEPGAIKSYGRSVGFISAGESVSLSDGEGVLALKVLPGLDSPLKQLTEATAGYAHLCCEQTAAKILAATLMYLTANNEGTKKKAEKIIVAGIARERKMFQERKMFRMYPRGSYVSEYYSGLAVRYLWKLAPLADVPGISPALRDAVEEGLRFADETAGLHKLDRVPGRVQSAEDAYACAVADAHTDSVIKFVEDTIDFGQKDPSLKDTRGGVQSRTHLAYAAAALLALGDAARGVRIANVVLKSLDENGRLYSTVDSIAAIAMVSELLKVGVVDGSAQLKVNGKTMRAAEAAALTDIESVEVIEGTCAIEATHIVIDRWESYAASFPVRVGFREVVGGAPKKAFTYGDRATLRVEIPDGYRNGDLVHVSLPAALAWIRGGGRVQRFTIDFEQETVVEIPVLTIGRIEGQQHFGVCVRNMFEEERAASPGLLRVKAA